MSWKTASASWEWLAKRDPLWAILTRNDKRNGGWQLDEFFATGEAEIDAVFARLAERGVSVDQRDLALDFGCGVGRLSRALAGRFAQVHGVDVSPTMVERARKLNQDRPGRSFFLNREADLRAFEAGRYSFVYSSIVLQHIPYPASRGYIEEFLRLLRPGGLAVFQIPTEDRTAWPIRIVRRTAQELAQRLSLPLPALHMEMNVVPRSEIESIAAAGAASVEDAAYTQAHEADASGRPRFAASPPPGRMRSMLFVMRRRGVA